MFLEIMTMEANLAKLSDYDSQLHKVEWILKDKAKLGIESQLPKIEWSFKLLTLFNQRT